MTNSTETIDVSNSAALSTLIAPELNSDQGKVTTTSIQIASHFGKRHGDVLRAIRKLVADVDPGFYQRNFASVTVDFINGKGGTQQAEAFRITRDGFTFLAMGFTGRDAAQWKVAYIDAFNKMEAQLLAAEALKLSAPIPFAVNPGDTLSKEEADTLRDTLKDAAEKLPVAQQGKFMKEGWSKLCAHFKGVTYRKIPRAEFTTAVSIVARHVAKWEVLDALPDEKVDVARELAREVGGLAEQVAYDGISKGDMNWTRTRWLMAVASNRDGVIGMPSIHEIKPEAFVGSVADFTRMIDAPNGVFISHQELHALASVCMNKLNERVDYYDRQRRANVPNPASIQKAVAHTKAHA